MRPNGNIIILPSFYDDVIILFLHDVRMDIACTSSILGPKNQLENNIEMKVVLVKHISGDALITCAILIKHVHYFPE